MQISVYPLPLNKQVGTVIQFWYDCLPYSVVNLTSPHCSWSHRSVISARVERPTNDLAHNEQGFQLACTLTQVCYSRILMAPDLPEEDKLNPINITQFFSSVIQSNKWWLHIHKLKHIKTSSVGRSDVGILLKTTSIHFCKSPPKKYFANPTIFGTYNVNSQFPFNK